MFARRLVSAHHASLLEERARAMRRAPTTSEKLLWSRLSGSKTGFPFRRQLVIAHFIADFACTKLRLVIEVDGPYHIQRIKQDIRREAALRDLGWSVLRINEQEVFEDLDRVVMNIQTAALQRQQGAKEP